jgi:hypothetical protein
VGVDDGVQVLARHMDRAVNDEARAVHLVGRVVEDVAVDVDLYQARGGDLLVEKAVGIDQELVLGSRHPQRDVVVDQVGPAVMRDQAVGGGEIDPRLPLVGAHALARRRHFGEFRHAASLRPLRRSTRLPDVKTTRHSGA